MKIEILPHSLNSSIHVYVNRFNIYRYLLNNTKGLERKRVFKQYNEFMAHLPLNEIVDLEDRLYSETDQNI